MCLRSLISARPNNKVLADKDKIDKNEAKSHIIAGFVTLVLHQKWGKCLYWEYLYQKYIYQRYCCYQALKNILSIFLNLRSKVIWHGLLVINKHIIIEI